MISPSSAQPFSVTTLIVASTQPLGTTTFKVSAALRLKISSARSIIPPNGTRQRPPNSPFRMSGCQLFSFSYWLNLNVEIPFAPLQNCIGSAGLVMEVVESSGHVTTITRLLPCCGGGGNGPTAPSSTRQVVLVPAFTLLV